MRCWTFLVMGFVAGCSGGKDPGTTTTTTTTITNLPVDADNDGFALPDDCNDADPSVYPGADDPPYDGVDSDCGGGPDDDVDGDGYAFDGVGGTDCDDNNPDIHPYALETCNGVDDDCDGNADGPDAYGAVAWFTDADGDTFGDPATAVIACDAPVGSVDNDLDCNDGDEFTYTGAPSVACDGSDNDCDPLTFEAGQVALDGVIFATVDGAVAAATQGSVVTLCEGRYPTNGNEVSVTVGLSMVGAGGGLSVLDAEGSGGVVAVQTTAPVFLTGLALTGGSGLAFGDDRRGGGLYLTASAHVTGTDLWIVDNISGQGAGAYLGDNATLNLESSLVVDNHGSDLFAIVDMGGGIYGEDGAWVLLDDSHVDANTALACGGVRLGRDGLLDGNGNSTVNGNATDGLAGGGVCTLWDSRIYDITIAGNDSANASGGVDAVDTELVDVILDANISALSGGGISIWGVSSLFRCTVTGNEGGIDGGGLAMFGSDSVITVEDSVFHSNVATFFASFGGGVRMFQGTLVSVDTDWGDGATDNAPNDIALEYSDTVYDHVGIGSFTCFDDGAAGACL